MVSAISSVGSADFVKTLTIIQQTSQPVYSDRQMVSIPGLYMKPVLRDFLGVDYVRVSYSFCLACAVITKCDMIFARRGDSLDSLTGIISVVMRD